MKILYVGCRVRITGNITCNHPRHLLERGPNGQEGIIVARAGASPFLSCDGKPFDWAVRTFNRGIWLCNSDELEPILPFTADELEKERELEPLPA